MTGDVASGDGGTDVGGVTGGGVTGGGADDAASDGRPVASGVPEFGDVMEEAPDGAMSEANIGAVETRGLAALRVHHA